MGNPKNTIQTMRNIKLILLGLIITVNLSAQTSRRIIHLSGTILDKYPIKMTLNIKGDKVLGFYYYEKYKSKILLEGQINEGKVTLKESPDFESEFKIGFIGDLKGDSFSGVWTDKDKNKTLNFKTSVDFDKLVIIPDKIINIEGTYDNIRSSDKFFSSIDLKYITDDLFCFEISNGTESGCVGYLKGLIKMTDLNQGKYSGNSCEKLDFIITTNELTVNENNCDFHGMSCPFDGKYKKK